MPQHLEIREREGIAVEAADEQAQPIDRCHFGVQDRAGPLMECASSPLSLVSVNATSSAQISLYSSHAIAPTVCDSVTKRCRQSRLERTRNRGETS
jgi:hypothetical protein